MRGGAAIHWFGREDYELPDRRLRYLCFASGHAFIDRALYLPKEWTDDPDRLKRHMCLRCRFATKPKLATRMIARAIAASVPFKWVAGDTVYGVWQHRTATASGRQGLRAWGQQRSRVSILGQATATRYRLDLNQDLSKFRAVTRDGRTVNLVVLTVGQPFPLYPD